MIILMRKTTRFLNRLRILRIKCDVCKRDLYEYAQQKGAKVWKKVGRPGKFRYYCDDCRKDLFEGVKLRGGLKDESEV